MKYVTEIKTNLEGYFKQAQIEVDKKDIELLAKVIDCEYEGIKCTSKDIKDVDEVLKKYDIVEIWKELKDQVLIDISNYVNDMSNSKNNFSRMADILIDVDSKFGDEITEEQHELILSGKIFEGTENIELGKDKIDDLVKIVKDKLNINYCDGNFSVKELKVGEYYLVDWTGPCIAKLTEINKNTKEYKFENEDEDEDSNYIFIEEKLLKDFIQRDEPLKEGDKIPDSIGGTFTKSMMFSNKKNFSVQELVAGEYYSVDWDGPTVAKLTIIDHENKEYTFEKKLEEGDHDDFRSITIKEDAMMDFMKSFTALKVGDKLPYNGDVFFDESFMFSNKTESNKENENKVNFSKDTKLVAIYKDGSYLYMDEGTVESGPKEPIADLDDEKYTEFYDKSTLESYCKSLDYNMKNWKIVNSSEIKEKKNFSIKLPCRVKKNHHKNFSNEEYPEEDKKNREVKSNFDGTELPIRARFTMKNPRF